MIAWDMQMNEVETFRLAASRRQRCSSKMNQEQKRRLRRLKRPECCKYLIVGGVGGGAQWQAEKLLYLWLFF